MTKTSKSDFVRERARGFDLAIGVGYTPEVDGDFLGQCHIGILVDQFRQGNACVRDLDSLISHVKGITAATAAERDFTYASAEVRAGAEKLRRRFPPDKRVFIMTPFQQEQGYPEAVRAIKARLSTLGYTGLVATDFQAHSELWYNVQAYMIACSRGVAVFGDSGSGRSGGFLSGEAYNANVAIESGYMRALGREVLFLKDRSLEKLPTDYMGSLYQEIDLEQAGSLESAIDRWLVG